MSDSVSDDADRRHEEMLRFLYACPIGLIEISGSGTIRLMNPVAMRWLLPLADGPFNPNLFIILGTHAPELQVMLDAFTDKEGIVCENHRFLTGAGATGDEVQVLACTLVKLGSDRAIATISDVSRQVAQEHRLRRAEGDLQVAKQALAIAGERERADRALGVQAMRFGAALRTMSQALCMFDAAGGLIVANERLAQMFGIEPSSVFAGVTMETMLARATVESTLQPADIDQMRSGIQHLRAAGRQAASVTRLMDGRTLAVNFVPMDGDGWLVTLEDITERKLAEAKMTHMALHDGLTGLPNRVMFHERLREAVRRSLRGESSAVLCLDLDHFKAVNDTLGHPIGDALLREVSRRLRQQVREIDTVARLGGDEFAILQSGVDQPVHAVTLSKRLIEALSLPYEINGHNIVIGTSVGIALLPDDGKDAHQILKNADLALYGAKADGRGDYRFFEPAMHDRMLQRRTLETDLRAALRRGEFEVYYQPLMNLKTRCVSGFEALLRWNHPVRGLLPPSDFISLAEDIGLIVPLGRWVLRQACSDAKCWPGLTKVAVNVSVIQFGSRTLVDDVVAALTISGLDPKRLELEITETVMLNDTDETLVILHKLRDLGVGIAMDDFGTGYSSLSYLRRFPFSKVKIDRSFIESLGKGTDCDAIVTAVTDLCEILGMTTVAEGVETEEQLDYLRSGHCGEAQGYLFSRPRPASEVASICKMLAKSDFGVEVLQAAVPQAGAGGNARNEGLRYSFSS